MLDESRQTLVDVIDDEPGNPWAAWFIDQIDGISAQLAAMTNQISIVARQLGAMTDHLALVVEQTASLPKIVCSSPGDKLAVAVSFARPSGPTKAAGPHRRARMNNA